jgi:hypothetical protein
MRQNRTAATLPPFPHQHSGDGSGRIEMGDDHRGHSAGDELLQRVAGLLKSSFRLKIWSPAWAAMNLW